MKNKILNSVRDSLRAIEQLTTSQSLQFLEKSALLIASCFSGGGKVLVAGNGGSFCDASHFAEELTGVFREKRAALPAMILGEPGHLTCVGNDIGFKQVFARAIEAFGKKGDLFIGLSTSGNSENIIAAFECAKALGLQTIAFLGKGGGKLKDYADLELIIEGFTTSDRIQEAHMTAMHIIIELVEEYLFNQTETELHKQIIEAARGW